MPLVKSSSKSQIVLPAVVRRRLDLMPGDLIEISEEGGRIILGSSAEFVGRNGH